MGCVCGLDGSEIMNGGVCKRGDNWVACNLRRNVGEFGEGIHVLC